MAPDALTAAPVRVRLRKVPPAAGLQWIRRGFRTFWRRPLGFIGLWMFFTLCLFIVTLASVTVSPMVMLAIAAMLPLLTVGYMQAASDVLDDLKLRPGVFGAPFTATAAVARNMLAIMAIYVAAVALLAACADAMDGGETRRWLHLIMTPLPDGKPPAIPPMTEGIESTIRFMMLGVTLVSIPLWHAPALVYWGRQGTAQSLFSSVVALWYTRGAFATFVLGWMVVSVAFEMLAQILTMAFGFEAISLAALTGQMILSITYFVSMWFGFADTFEITSGTAYRTATADAAPPAP